MMRPAVAAVVRQHADDAAILHTTRSGLTAAPHVKLHHLRRCDERIAAHLDGLSVAGEQGWPVVEAMLDNPDAGAAFVASVRSLHDRRTDTLDRMLAFAAASPVVSTGLRAAFGWEEPAALRGVVSELLGSEQPLKRSLGIAASAMHRVDPLLGHARPLEDPDAEVRSRAYRTAGELGRREFLSYLGRAVDDVEPICRFWAAWSAVLLGDRQRALELLQALSAVEGLYRARAFRLAMVTLPPSRAHEELRLLSQDPSQIRWAIKGAGFAGDPAYIPWLTRYMSDDKLARLAGESFTLITGADLAWLDLERKPPENFESGPNDDPNDADVAMEEDDGLPWPDAERIERWWAQNSSRFVPGQRYFVGAPVTREHCIEVLKTGYQRQRILAAHHLCLLEPGSVLFEWRAPAWRQAQALTALV